MQMRWGIVAFLILFVMAAFAGGGYALSDKPQVVIETSKGTVTLELYPDEAPKTVDNFLRYARWGHYDGTIFHRVIPDFMIQGGGFTPEMKQKLTEMPIENEADSGLKNDRGAVAMARTQDPHSASAQFFINTRNNNALNHKNKTPEGWGYTVFGRVTQGMDVVDAISKVETGNRGSMENVPIEPVVMTRVTIKE
jgi:peptidyl-prolyl cis-trans isomerase B (cyclophilin B)